MNRGRAASCPSADPDFSARLARQIASTGDDVDVAFAEFLGRCPLPWDTESGTWVGAMPAIRRPPPPRRKGFTYQYLTHDDVLILLRVAERYAATIAMSELVAPPNRRGLRTLRRTETP